MSQSQFSLRFFFFVLLSMLLANCGPVQHPADDFAVWGIDVSRHQGAIDWPQVAASGLEFAFVKATEGGTHVDETFRYNWAAIAETAVRRGAYHYYKPGVDAQLQANNFLSQVGELRPGDLPPVLDIEERGILTTAAFVQHIQQWLDLVEKRYGVRPILYTGQKFYNRYLAGHFPLYPIWIARYKAEIPLLADGRTFAFWQFTDSGRLAGIPQPVDINVFSGTSLDLALLALPPSGLPAITQRNKPEPSEEGLGLIAVR